MTSHEWKPGNRYGSVESPRYNAITYTWGRWKLESNELQHIKALDIGGVHWDVPRIHPSHFNVDDFKNSLCRATEPVSLEVSFSSTENASKHVRDSTEFIWLDVACIDQRGMEPRSAAEVGRQAEIFKGAQNVFIWLTDFHSTELQHLLTNLSGLDPIGSPGDDVDFARQMYLGLKRLFDDPWFSSLWTLQEVFLRQDGIIISREGRTTSNERLNKDFSFLDILGIYETIDIPRIKATGHALMEPFTLLSDLSDRAGLTAIATQNAMVALVASENRTTTHDEDRVYAIQQIFGLRLGNTSTKAAPGLTFTRTELEVQLGQELLKNYPVHSQAHIFTKPVQPGNGWKVNGDSVIPQSVTSEGNPVFPQRTLHAVYTSSEESTAELLRQDAQDLAASCSLGVCKLETGTLGCFKDSRLCPFATAVTRARQFEQHPIVSYLFSEPSPGHLLTYMDASSQFNGCTVSLHSGFYDSNSRSGQRALAEWLCCSYPQTDLVVLLLGRLRLEGQRTDMYALLLLLDHESTWKRIGFCQWQTNVTTIGGEPLAGYDFFHGNTDDWTKCDGYFG